MAASSTPGWPHCRQGAASDDSFGCRGRRVDPYAECLAHLTDTDRAVYLAGLQPGADIDHRGTRLTTELLDELLSTLKDPISNRPQLGETWFQEAQFEGDARFDLAQFGSSARFDRAEFGGDASFTWAEFGKDAWFSGTQISGNVQFDRAEIRLDAGFASVKIGGNAWFRAVKFGGEFRFHGAEIVGDVDLGESELERARAVGPLTCHGTLDFTQATFESALTIEAATAVLRCERTRWASTASLRLRYATVDLSDAVMEHPVSIVAHSRPFFTVRGPVAEPELPDARARVASLRGADAAHLTLINVDLTDCLFAGTTHLDQLRLEGRYLLPLTPSGVRWRNWVPLRWTRRRTLAEEQHWRAARGTTAGGWTSAPETVEVLEPTTLAPVYRQLRKTFEDGKHEPGAADFYYGEMEMRRHADDIPWAERSLLAAYWAISGYGLRASRALGWLLLAMTATVLAMMLWGLPKDDPKPESTGTVDGQRISMTTDTANPVNPDGPYRERLSAGRFEKSLQVVINSVVFRSSGQELTTRGTYTEMLSRIGEPVLLGLAVLAVRGRIKR
ncbi:hypothetical protein DSC45_23755 [Streptomyces sp. YIM 130001]|uniref:pentapeptide repeat-containing protein n=1 Tax=Streptomyces sp. YIM 130001 TaxID=2259644 RepID=UPI000E64ED5B|nr:pentapeptide repeat-containing protein [Streptomyces sp. YIM 130001]RII13369.1 hypothetical protein DSC45_23755 [Streptomyces sp. YIM 130001]